MRGRLRVIFVLLVATVIVIYIVYNNSCNNKYAANVINAQNASKQENVNINKEIHIAVVVCRNRSRETLVMIKSALIFTKHPIKFYLFTDKEATAGLTSQLQSWANILNTSFSYTIQPVRFPPGEFQKEWRKLFKPCASQRLFLPSLLNDTDAVLYVDTDTLFLGPVEQVWNYFDAMNSSQLAAVAPEHEDPQIGWYNRFAKHPFYKPLGVNTGVMLMNLTRMRSFGWEEYVGPIYKQYKRNIPWGDQDIINIIFSFYPEKLFVYGCKYNYRADHCMYTSVCKAAEKEGVVVLHGSRGIFHNDHHPTFRSVYKAFEDFQLLGDIFQTLYIPLKRYLDASPTSQCGAVRHAFLKNLVNFV